MCSAVDVKIINLTEKWHPVLRYHTYMQCMKIENKVTIVVWSVGSERLVYLTCTCSWLSFFIPRNLCYGKVYHAV